jgi:hypothetical protein
MFPSQRGDASRLVGIEIVYTDKPSDKKEPSQRRDASRLPLNQIRLIRMNNANDMNDKRNCRGHRITASTY